MCAVACAGAKPWPAHGGKATEGVGVEVGTYSLVDAEVDAGGPRLRRITLSEELFAAAAMQALCTINTMHN